MALEEGSQLAANRHTHAHTHTHRRRYDEYDNAATVMMTHSPVAWEHVTFKDVIVKVSSADQYYKAMRFYLEVCVCVCVCVLGGLAPLSRRP